MASRCPCGDEGRTDASTGIPVRSDPRQQRGDEFGGCLLRRGIDSVARLLGHWDPENDQPRRADVSGMTFGLAANEDQN